MGPRVGCWAAHLRRNESTITYHAERTLTKGSIPANDPFRRRTTSPWPMAGDPGPEDQIQGHTLGGDAPKLPARFWHWVLDISLPAC